MENINSDISEGLNTYPIINNTNNSSFFDNLKSINITTWLLIILILALLGFNIFIYLAKGTQTFADIFGPLFNKLFGVTIATTSQTVDITAEGAKAVVNKTSDVIQNSLTEIQNITPSPNNANSTYKGETTEIDKNNVKYINYDTPLNKTIQNSSQDYQPYEANSSVNISGKAKSGWCYVGEDRGFRTCAKVGVNDSCMSGNIFPTQEICINPNLRN